jgi:hypothetical protein
LRGTDEPTHPRDATPIAVSKTLPTYSARFHPAGFVAF